MSETSVLWEETVEPGAAWSHVLKRGTSLLITDMEGGANVGAIFYNFECPAERYNLPDTLKAQHVARLTKGCVLYSDMGRILCSITEDTVGWHDPLGGCSNAAVGGVQVRRGALPAIPQPLSPQRAGQLPGGAGEVGAGAARPGRQREFLQPRDGGRRRRHDVSSAQFHVALACGTARRDERAGGSEYLPASAGYRIPSTSPSRCGCRSAKRVPVGAADPCRRFRPENERGFTLTERYFV